MTGQSLAAELTAVLSDWQGTTLTHRERSAWMSISGRETLRRSAEIAHGLLALGVEASTELLLTAPSGAEWLFADLGAALLGMTTRTVRYAADAVGVDAVAVVADPGERDRLSSSPAFRAVMVAAATASDDSLDRFAARGVAWAASHPDALTGGAREQRSRRRSIDADGERDEAAWLAMIAAVPAALGAGRRVVVTPPLQHPAARAVAYAALLRRAVLVLAPAATPLTTSKPELLVVDTGALAEMTRRVGEALAEQRLWSRTVRGNPGRLGRAVLRRAATTVIGDALRVVLVIGAVTPAQRALMARVGVSATTLAG